MPTSGYIRFPAISGDTIVFTAEDDLWRVSAAGGRAERLTAGTATALHPRFSPDGRAIACAGRDEGPEEVYLMPADGGPARRVTYLGAPRLRVSGWQPDGSAILFASNAGQFSPRKTVLFAVSPDGGEPRPLPYGVAHAIAFGPQRVTVLGRNMREPAFWKRYHGGTAGHFWIDRSGDGTFERFLSLNGDLASPSFAGQRFYFISDHEGLGMVYSCLSDGSDLRRHAHDNGFYARNLSGDGSRLVFHAGGDLFVLDPSSGAVRQVAVTLPGAQSQRARKFVAAGQFLESASLNAQGTALALVTRGKAFSLPAFDGPVLQHGEPDGVRYRFLAWLADGQRLVGIQDDGGEPRLVVFSADGSAPPRVFDTLDVGHVVDLRPAPTGEQVALTNHRHEIAVIDLAQGTMRVIDTGTSRPNFGAMMAPGIAWSPDARWLAYAFALNPQQTIIKLADLTTSATGATALVTDPVRYDAAPAFDPGGKYLYFLSARDFDPVRDSLHFEFGFPKGVRPYLVTLRADLPSPFTPATKLDKEPEQAGDKADSAKSAEAAPAPVAVDLEGITTRIVAFPVPEGRYTRVLGTSSGVAFASRPVEGTRNEPFPPGPPDTKASLDHYSFETYKTERIADGISDFGVSADGKTLLARSGDRLRVLKAGEKAPAGDAPGRESGWVDMNRVKVSVRPAAEWRQMLDEAWRLQREQYWVADMAGIDWPAIHRRYAPLVERVASRGELSDLMWEMQGELGTSHAYEIGGDHRQPPNYRQGFLGVDWQFDPATGAYRIARIARGDPWNQDATSPLLAPGVNVKAGDAVVAIDGQVVSAARGPRELLVNQAGNEVRLTIRAADNETRAVTVKAQASEYPARYRDWVEANRQAVHAATGGRVGYLHVPDMAADGYAEFHRYYLAEYDHEGLIVDIRWNGGGEVSGLLLEKLMRPRLGYDFQRWGHPQPYFQESRRGPLVALTDENAGSDGDIFSHSFKMLGLGPLIGKRTWGGVIGIEPYIPLADGTFTTQPEYSFWFRDVGWGVENYGTDPTIEVDYPPQAYARGVDPQLDRGIAEALRLIEGQSTATPTPGPRPRLGQPARG